MSSESQEMFQVCRFCLCQDEALLIPLEDIVDFSVALQDVSMVTGIDINEDNIASYAMCLECTAKLKSSVTFRNVCLSNEAHFEELYTVWTASTEESCVQILDVIEPCAAPTTSVQESSVDTFDFAELSDGSGESKDFDLSIFGTIFAESISRFNQQNTEVGVFSYSANYIKPGEIVFSEEEDSNQSMDWDRSLNPPAPSPVIHIRVPGKRKFHLCDRCGIMVNHIPSHIYIHKEDYIYSCPQCPVKAKSKTNLRDHIKTVHLRTVMKTCDICGKGFIHHKTYRYHMLNHQDEGKTIECVDCSKTFSNSIYLRDHINRVHKPDKKIKKKKSGEGIRRKRNRSRSVVEKSV